MARCKEILEAGLNDLGLALENGQIAQLLDFIKLIDKWNKTYNLTAIRDKADMVSLHLLDSLSLLPFMEGSRVIDIGTGAGLPGLPLAICLPETEFTLLDSNAKKTRFVQQAILELKLRNVTVHRGRVEQFHPEILFDAGLCRAFADLKEIVKMTGHLFNQEGVLLAMKGQMPQFELAQLPFPTSIIPLHVPGIAAARCLVRIKAFASSEEK
ncbi:MAG: 16S rRNA (guanine(527)-N(7))-methyltransferase RsmG [Gammaproteobacteria bacterium HGW-Gammaproteobacteria-3]|nr:MAG: 16S rRNA (guanine(527)-N(7))-methyltransferase RsmG [Gammaproteobacteria bacterium HGW-Gammaproteobacteria-3]